MAGTIIVPQVVTTSPDEMMYSVSVLIIVVIASVGIELGMTDGTGGAAKTDGTVLTVMVMSTVDGTEIA